MKISMICAADLNGGIGLNNELLYKFKEDLTRFKKLTSGHHILMGRKTFESIGRPLPNRVNIILSRSKNVYPGCLVTDDINNAITIAEIAGEQELFILGGESIYRECIKYADKIYLTRINDKKPADAFFPNINEWPGDWEGKTDGGTENFVFIDYVRIK